MRYEIGDVIKQTHPMRSQMGEIIAINLLHGEFIEYIIKDVRSGCLEIIQDRNFDNIELIKERKFIDRATHFLKEEKENSIVIELQNGVELMCVEYMHKDVPASEFEEVMYKDITISSNTIKKIKTYKDNVILYKKVVPKDFTYEKNNYYTLMQNNYYYGIDKNWQSELGMALLYKTQESAIRNFHPKSKDYGEIELCEVNIITKKLKKITHSDFMNYNNKYYKGETDGNNKY